MDKYLNYCWREFVADTAATEKERVLWARAAIVDLLRANRIMTAREIYEESEMEDIPMYLALRELVQENVLLGLDPYEGNISHNMNDWVYTINPNTNL